MHGCAAAPGTGVFVGLVGDANRDLAIDGNRLGRAEAVVEMTSYHTDINADFNEVDRAVRHALGVPLPAWTAVEVARLRRPGARVEFRIVAHLPTALE